MFQNDYYDPGTDVFVPRYSFFFFSSWCDEIIIPVKWINIYMLQ